MKLAAVLLSLIGLYACSFPEYDATPTPSTGGTGGTGAALPTCSDNQRNGDEIGIDCGLAACSKACPPGQPCGGNDDCDAVACLGGLCQDPGCADELKNQDESDTDCGGEQGCARCTVNQRCRSTSDCDGGLCASGLCRAATCKDGIVNGNETDLDCGGDSCTPCGVGQVCGKTDDCDGIACSKGQCQPASCHDEIWNQDETDQDCGGSCSEACEDGTRCKVAHDCQSGICPITTLRCAVPSCSDGVANGDEPGKDCGGSCSTKCVVLDRCTQDDDCTTSRCVDDRCVPESATGVKLLTGTWTATASSTFGGSNPKYAIDGVSTSDWTSGVVQQLGMSFTVDMQTEQVFFSIEIDCLNTPMDVPNLVDVALSSDGNFTGVPAKPAVPGSTKMVITFGEAQIARYIRLSLADIHATQWWRIDELRVKQ